MLLEVNNLHVHVDAPHQTIPVLEDVSLALSPGEILGVVGESGAGKSLTGITILGLLDKALKVKQGEIRFSGKSLLSMSNGERHALRGTKIAAVFQDPMTALDPMMTIGKQLIETIRHHSKRSKSEAIDRAVELLTEVGIPNSQERLDAFPHQFSGGMRQRVVIALALAADPEVLIADEPTTALDVSIQAQVLELLQSLCKTRDLAIMLVTHDIGVIAQTADRVAVFYAGSIVETGPMELVIGNPRHPYTRGLIRAIPEIGMERGAIRQIEGTMPKPGHWPDGCKFRPRCQLATVECLQHQNLREISVDHEIRCHLDLGDLAISEEANEYVEAYRST